MASPDSKNSDRDRLAFLVRRDAQMRQVELYSWFVLTAIPMFQVFRYRLEGFPWEVILRKADFELAAAFLIFIFPVLYKLVFGQMPFEHVRNRRKYYSSYHSAQRSYAEKARRIAAAAAATKVRTLYSDNAGKPLANAERFLEDLALSSRKLADRLYGRSGVYLLVGVMVAFFGLAFFYVQTPETLETKDVTALIVSLAPKFGVLLFIELVAFFFLRQYRTAMDEFRYYEAVKRRREEVLALVRMGSDQGKPVDLLELVRLGHFFSTAGRLQKEETTEIIEARKLEKNETAVLEKAIDAVAQARK